MIELRTTVVNNFEAARIARTLVENKKADSVYIRNVGSFYKWEKEVVQTTGFEISILTTENNIDDVLTVIKKVSDNDSPEILIYRVESTPEFIDLINKSYEQGGENTNEAN